MSEGFPSPLGVPSPSGGVTGSATPQFLKGVPRLRRKARESLARHGYDNGNNRDDERNNRNDNRAFRDPPICFGGIWGRAQSRRHCSDRRDAVIENVTSAAILRLNSLRRRALKTSLISNICFIEHDVLAEVDPGGISLKSYDLFSPR